MNPVECARCQASFDVSHLPPDSVFECGACGARLIVPSRRSRSPRGRSRGRSGSLPAVGFIVGGCVLVVLGLALVIMPGGEPAEEQAAPEPEPRLTVGDRIRDLELGLLAAHSQKDLAGLRRIHQEAEALSAFGTAKKAAEFALELSGDLDWAHASLGHVPFNSSGLPDADDVLHPTPDWGVLQAAKRDGWLTPERSSEVADAKRRFLNHRLKIEKDAHYRKVWEVRESLARDPYLSGLEFDTIDQRPFLVFVERPTDELRARNVTELARNRAALLGHLYQSFMEKFGVRLSVPRLESDSYLSDVVLKVFVFGDRESYERYLERKSADSGGTRYDSKDQWLVIPPAKPGDARSRSGENACFHQGVHQLVQHLTKRCLEESTGAQLGFSDPRLISRSHWFHEGIAEYFASASRTSGSWALFLVNTSRLRAWKTLRAQGCADWGLAEMLRVTGSGDLSAASRRGSWLPGLFNSQAWAFFYFLDNFGNGKYRAKLLEYVRRELHGESGHRVFLEVFGLEKIAGSLLEQEFTAYSNQLLEQIRLPRGVGD